MDLVSEVLTRHGYENRPEVPACSCALHEPRHDGGQVLPAGIVGEHASFSSFSEAWLAHARHYGQHAVRRFNLGSGSVVLELAGSGESRAAGLSAGRVLFGHETVLGLAARGKAADLVIARNVLAQLPDPNPVVAGVAAVLKPAGILILEFPHLLRLIERHQFAAVDPEGFSSFSLSATEFLLDRHGLRVFDLDELQGGSLRLFCCHAGSAQREQPGVAELRAAESMAGLSDLQTSRDCSATLVG